MWVCLQLSSPQISKNNAGMVCPILSLFLPKRKYFNSCFHHRERGYSNVHNQEMKRGSKWGKKQVWGWLEKGLGESRGERWLRTNAADTSEMGGEERENS